MADETYIPEPIEGIEGETRSIEAPRPNEGQERRQEANVWREKDPGAALEDMAVGPIELGNDGTGEQELSVSGQIDELTTRARSLEAAVNSHRSVDMRLVTGAISEATALIEKTTNPNLLEKLHNLQTDLAGLIGRSN